MRHPRTGRPVISIVLSAALVLGVPAAPIGAIVSAEPNAVGSSLEILTEPAGAVTYVDGEPIGATPVKVGALPAGDHRVRVVKDGYLENSRVVSLSAGQGQNLHIRLTPDAGRRSTINAQVEDTPSEEKKGGGSKKWLFLGLGAVAVGGAVYLATKGGNKAPTAAININAGGTALMGATAVAFNANGSSDPDGDTLTYSWNFGDGGSGSGLTTTHVYNQEGTFNVVVTVSDGKKSSTANGSVSVRSVTGNWSGTFSNGGSFVVTVVQSGSGLTGSFQHSQFPNADTFAGSVSAPRNATWSFSFFCDTWSLTANPDVTVLDGPASCDGAVQYNINMVRQ